MVAQVEKTPAVIKAGLKKEDAEALKAKLEAGECFARCLNTGAYIKGVPQQTVRPWLCTSPIVQTPYLLSHLPVFQRVSDHMSLHG